MFPPSVIAELAQQDRFSNNESRKALLSPLGQIIQFAPPPQVNTGKSNLHRTRVSGAGILPCFAVVASIFTPAKPSHPRIRRQDACATLQIKRSV